MCIAFYEVIATRGYFYKFKWRIKRKIIIFKPKIVLSISLVFLVILSCVFTNSIITSVSQLSVTALEGELFECINSSVVEFLESENVDFESLYKINKADNGSTESIFVNAAKVNEIKSSVAKAVISAVEDMDTAIEVPLGSLFGGVLLNGRGYKLKVKMLSVSSVQNEIVNKIEDSGVNQTHLSSYVTFTASIDAKIGNQTIRASCSDEILLCESVIIGKVPNTFTNINVIDEKTSQWLEKYRGG